MRRRPPWLLLLVWAATRGMLLLVATQTIPTGHGEAFRNDVTLYRHWSEILMEGEFPAGDEKWQYPPFAALPLLAPACCRWATTSPSTCWRRCATS
ncbi:hypothetical protein GCM10027612_06890 [Microbispora bryophytorum subsp. camponoti]